MKRWHVTHGREGFGLHVYELPAWTVAVAKMCDLRPIVWLARWAPVYRVWNWLLCLEYRFASDHGIPLSASPYHLRIDPARARALHWDRGWIDDIMTDPDHLPDGSLKKEFWR